MSVGDQYRAKALELFAIAETEIERSIQNDFENLARAYFCLAEQADRNARLDVTYEPPPPKLDEPVVK
jgi:hypothetical protein